MSRPKVQDLSTDSTWLSALAEVGKVLLLFAEEFSAFLISVLI